jgi:hypothetical protein
MNRIVTINPCPEDFGIALVDPNHKMKIESPIEDCIFHKWTTKRFTHPENEQSVQDYDFGLVELPDGKIEYFKPEQIVFKK